MKTYIDKNKNVIIVSIVFVTSVILITLSSMSYAVGNNSNIIYTRDELSEMIVELQNDTNVANTFLKSYPVGSIYTSVSSTSPATLYGGTWVYFGSGRTLVEVDTTQTEFSAVEKTGGSKEMQTHSHIFSSSNDFPTANHKHLLPLGSVGISGSNLTRYPYIFGDSKYLNGVLMDENYTLERPVIAFSASKIIPQEQHLETTMWLDFSNIPNSVSKVTGTTDSFGNGSSGNLQPYITVYMWKRTA